MPFIKGYKRSVEEETKRLGAVKRAWEIMPWSKKLSQAIKNNYKNDPTYAKRIGETRKKIFLEQGFLNSPETRKKISIAQLGRIPWNKGKTKWGKCKICGKQTKSWIKTCSKECLTILKSGKNSSLWKGGSIKKICIICKKEFMTTGSYRIKKYCSNFCYGEDLRRGIPKEILRKMLSCRKPNNDEAYLFSILEKNFPHEWNFVGDGKVIIEGKNPDFININGKKQIIELFGNHWHKPEEVEPRMNIFARYGYKTLILWDYELKKENILMEKLKSFNSLIAEERT